MTNFRYGNCGLVSGSRQDRLSRTLPVLHSRSVLTGSENTNTIMPKITNWRRESRSPTLAYRNNETGTRAVLHRAPDSYRYKWREAILVGGYLV